LEAPVLRPTGRLDSRLEEESLAGVGGACWPLFCCVRASGGGGGGGFSIGGHMAPASEHH